MSAFAEHVERLDRRLFAAMLRQERDEKTGEFVSSGTGSGVGSLGRYRAVEFLGGGITSTYTATLKGEKVVLKPADGSSDKEVRAERGAWVLNEFIADVAGVQLVNVPEARLDDDITLDVSKTAGGYGADQHTGPTAVMTFIDDAQTMSRAMADEGTVLWGNIVGEQAAHDMVLFDAIQGNVDRHEGNAMVDSEGTLWAIDNSRAFDATHYLPVGELPPNRLGIDPTLTADDRVIVETVLDNEPAMRARLTSEGVDMSAVDSIIARCERMLDTGSMAEPD